MVLWINPLQRLSNARQQNLVFLFVVWEWAAQPLTNLILYCCLSLKILRCVIINSLAPTAAPCGILSWWHPISNSLLWFVRSTGHLSAVVIEVIKHKVHVRIHIFGQMLLGFIFLVYWDLKIVLLTISRGAHFGPRLGKIRRALRLLNYFWLELLWLTKLFTLSRHSRNLRHKGIFFFVHCGVKSVIAFPLLRLWGPL
jgi:hypothetical protein